MVQAIKKLLMDVVFPAMVEEQIFQSFASENGNYEFTAETINVLKDGLIVKANSFSCLERVKLIVIDNIYEGDFLEFELDSLIEDVFSGRFGDGQANTFLFACIRNDKCDFVWVNAADFVYKMTEQGMTLRHLKQDMKGKPNSNATWYLGHPGELFLRDEGRPDRLLLNYERYILPHAIHLFSITLDKGLMHRYGFRNTSIEQFPGECLQSSTVLERQLGRRLSDVVDEFRNTSRGAFIFKLAEGRKDFSTGDLSRIIGITAKIIKDDPSISQFELIATLSRRVSPYIMDGLIQNIAVQYKAMIDDAKHAETHAHTSLNTEVVDVPDEMEDSDDNMDIVWMYPNGHDDGEYIGEMFEGDD